MALTTLIHDENLTITVQNDGSVYLVQQANEVRDTQQIIDIDAKTWERMIWLVNEIKENEDK